MYVKGVSSQYVNVVCLNNSLTPEYERTFRVWMSILQNVYMMVSEI